MSKEYTFLPPGMTVMEWLEEERQREIEREKIAQGKQEPPEPLSPETSLFAKQQLWTRCEQCGTTLYINHLKDYHYTCKQCGTNVPMTCKQRIESLLDPNGWVPLYELMSPVDPLKFVDNQPYTDRLEEAQQRTSRQDAVDVGLGIMNGLPVALGVMNFEFMAGTMGSVVGEKITRIIERATTLSIPLIIVCASGGARMQEGGISLMQMAKISAALNRYQNEQGNLFISVLASPTTGGVTASFGMLGDLTFAEPEAIIGFAGRRVIEQTLNITLPKHFQTAEHLKKHGMLDNVVSRKHLKGVLTEFILFHQDAPFARNKAKRFEPVAA